ncbi:anthranilate synthase family protein [Streptomyces qinglanensis]|uniref:anthranilate synthase n=1 Tax=Streptomyces qinglanensis TaxID=943816 RepID=A0A1H9R696_9ACTN|nr:anthranilate synthase family protein [Streptomyces qinglanensis]SER68252.1 phenazine biosynthesis protein phzE [Streptomyces qinglanensis]
MSGRLYERVLGDPSAPFALLHRSHRPHGVPGTDADRLEILVGPVSTPSTLARIPLPEPPDQERPDSAGRPGDTAAATAPGSGGDRHETLVLIPYRQLTERGYACVDDATPLVALTVTGQESLPLAEALPRLPRTATTLANQRFVPGDAEYADTVRRVVTEVIGRGAGANFVIRRDFVADLTDYSGELALAFFRRLLESESGAYWTFLVHTGERTLVGSSPERHISLCDGTAVMNPISGTYRYPPGGPELTGVLDFLADRKEAEELYMVVDEELKMMARVCEGGGRLAGPYLKEMARLAHTEYFIEGHTARGVREILRETLFAPTVTGSPLESAARVISQYERQGRGYYSGVAALIGRDARGGRTLDSAILIRTADIDATGEVRIGVGATLVRHSDPASEAAETRAKAAGLIAALEPGSSRSFAAHPSVRGALARRNEPLADFWLDEAAAAPTPVPGPHPPAPGRDPRSAGVPGFPGIPGAVGLADAHGFDGAADLAGRSVLVVDMEDTFTAMIALQLRALGLRVRVRRYDEEVAFDACDLVVMGPGPGDPRDLACPRMARLHAVTDFLLERQRPFVAVCLSHQALCRRLGFPLFRRDAPDQGVQREIDLFGVRERVGFYNTFAAHARHDKTDVDGVGVVEAARDPGTQEIHALRGPRFASMQFHAESVLTRNGPRIVGRALQAALGR